MKERRCKNLLRPGLVQEPPDGGVGHERQSLPRHPGRRSRSGVHAGHWREPIDEDDSEVRGFFIDDQLGVFQKPMEYWIGAMIFTPDAKILITGSRDTSIKFFAMPDLRETRTLKGHAEWVRSLALSPDGKVLASASDDQTIKLWDISTGRHVRTIKGHTDGVRGVVFSPDGLRLASASWDRNVKLWEGGPEQAD